MAENSTDLTLAVETNSTALKEALCAQQRLLQKVYHELDVEREAAASAASEALSMILRLQGEKAAVKMEAEQYKRLAEEKMHHAEESMEIFEDVMYQKEMEIASLEYQVQAYRYKLLSFGVEDLGVNDIKFPENLLQRNETLVGEASADSLSRRNSAPPKLLKLAYFRKGALDKDRSVSPDTEMIPRILEESAWEDENHITATFEKRGEGSSSVDINSYWEQIQKLDKIVEEMAGEQYNTRSRSSGFSSVSSPLNDSDHGQSREKSVDTETFSDACSTSIHDVFEVPETDESLVGCEEQAKSEEKSTLESEEKLKKFVSFPREPVKSCDKNEIDLGKRPLLLKRRDKKLILPRDRIAALDCHLAIVRPATIAAEAHAISPKMNTTMEIVEAEREDVRQEPVTSRGGEEELQLLYEIREKLNSIQSDIRRGNTKTKKTSPNYDLPMLQLTEEMMHFWL